MRSEGFQTLELRGVGRRFGRHSALRGLNLSIQQGEFIALLGPSGCGKSTALNCLAGLVPLTWGSIWMDGERFDQVPCEKRGFGMVFQNYALFPHLTVRGNVAFGLKMRKLPKAEIRARTQEAIRTVRLLDQADKLPAQLSGGQQQRVAIARSIVLEPAVMLMDEPLSNLDAKLRLEMRTEIRQMHQALGLTTVYVTHDQEEALSLADRLVVLREGLVQQIGTPEDLHHRPATWHVADFMGFRNLFRLTVDRRAGHGNTVTLRGHGLELDATAVGALGAGDTVVAGIRPEDVVVEPEGGRSEPAGGRGPWTRTGRAPTGTVLDARVQVVEFTGREFAVQVRIGDDAALHLRAPQRLVAGESIRVQLPVHRMLAFPEDVGSGSSPWVGSPTSRGRGAGSPEEPEAGPGPGLGGGAGTGPGARPGSEAVSQ
jgi:putative spermidine/putrescine transport system ATP-binding protein